MLFGPSSDAEIDIATACIEIDGPRIRNTDLE